MKLGAMLDLTVAQGGINSGIVDLTFAQRGMKLRDGRFDFCIGRYDSQGYGRFDCCTRRYETRGW